MKELQSEFIGRGEVKGMKFTLLNANPRAFIYKVESNYPNLHYEVFCRKENKYWDCVRYPNSRAFGVWAWSFYTLERAEKKFHSL